MKLATSWIRHLKISKAQNQTPIWRLKNPFNISSFISWRNSTQTTEKQNSDHQKRHPRCYINRQLLVTTTPPSHAMAVWGLLVYCLSINPQIRKIVGFQRQCTENIWKLSLNGDQQCRPQNNSNCLIPWSGTSSSEGGKSERLRKPVPLRTSQVESMTMQCGRVVFQLMLSLCFNVPIKNWMGPYQRTPKEVARATRSSGLGVRSVGPVGDFLEC